MYGTSGSGSVIKNQIQICIQQLSEYRSGSETLVVGQVLLGSTAVTAVPAFIWLPTSSLGRRNRFLLRQRCGSIIIGLGFNLSGQCSGSKV